MINNHGPRQAYYVAMGEGACYLFCYCHIAEDLSQRHIDAYQVYLEAIKNGWARDIHTKGWECYLDDPAKIMGSMYGGLNNWFVRKESTLYACRANEFEILRFEWVTPAKKYGHFIVGNGSGGKHWDSLGDSNTVRYGELQSKRILKYVGNGILRGMV